MKSTTLATVLICLPLLSASAVAENKPDLNERVNSAAEVLREIMGTPDKGIPSEIVEHANCVAVIPSVKKAAFIVGASYGQGLVTCRTHTGWSGPVFIRLEGASFGFQIGGQATDLILVSVNDKGFQDLLKSKIKLGGDASVAAGPVGRHASASTDILLKAELLAYSRAKGIFAGVDLNGAVVSQNQDDTNSFYGGSPKSYKEILSGDTSVPTAATRFVSTVRRYFTVARAN